MRVRIVGHNLPGRTWGCAGEMHDNIHVAVQVRKDPVGLVPGDTPQATWDVDVNVVVAEGALDFRGPAVHGKRGERFLYLTWGDIAGDGSFHMFRRAKLMLDPIDDRLIRRADGPGKALVARINLTDAKGGPRCARLHEPELAWSVG